MDLYQWTLQTSSYHASLVKLPRTDSGAAGVTERETHVRELDSPSANHLSDREALGHSRADVQ